MKWFRLYTEALHDPKVQRLHPSIFKHWINLLCIANGNQERGILPPADDVAFALRIKPVEAEKVLARLERAGLLDHDESGRLFPHNWTERQPSSDVVSTRVQRHREKKKVENNELAKKVTLHPCFSNALEVDTDTDKKKTFPKVPADARYFSDWWCYSFSLLGGIEYIFEGAKDGKHVSFLLKNSSLDELILRACDFLTSPDPYLTGKRTLSMFRSWINKTRPDGDQDEYRLIGIYPDPDIVLKEWQPWKESPRLTA